MLRLLYIQTIELNIKFFGIGFLILQLKQQIGSSLLRIVVDAYFCKVPFLLLVEREVFIRGF